MSDINYLSEYLEPNEQKLVTALAVGAAMLVGGAVLSSRMKRRGIERSVVPTTNLSLEGIPDLAVEGFLKFHDSVLGRENRRHVPFHLSIFLFILFANLIGLVPGMPAPTTSVAVNLGMALVVFVYFNYQGIREHGLGGYLKHFMGPVIWVAPLIFTVEIISTCMRLLTLNLRLFWNMVADHRVLGIFTTDVLSFLPGLSAPFYAIGTFVSLIQACVFTLLSMVYIMLATQHEDHGEEHGEAKAGHGH